MPYVMDATIQYSLWVCLKQRGKVEEHHMIVITKALFLDMMNITKKTILIFAVVW